MATVEVDVRDQIVAFKRALAPNRDVLKRAYADVKDHVSRSADRILREVDAGRPVVPELNYQDIRDGKVPEAVRQSIRSTGCAVVRGVFPADLAATGSHSSASISRRTAMTSERSRSGTSTSTSPG